MVVVSEALASDIPEVKVLYSECGYGGRIAESDIVLVARRNSEMVGVVRLASEGGVLILRGMQVKSSFQRQGVGTALLRQCVTYLGARSCYCLPYAHLVGFYSLANFRNANEAELPDFLVKRLRAYQVSGKEVLAMARPVKMSNESGHL